MRWAFLGLFASFLVACGGKAILDGDGAGGQNAGGMGTSNTSSNTSSSTSSSSAAVTSTAASTTGSGGGLPEGCPLVCSALYDCGLEMAGGTQLCPGFTGAPAEKANFVGDSMSGCVQTCEGPAGAILTSLVDPDDCASTIDDIASLNSAFEEACQNGFGANP